MLVMIFLAGSMRREVPEKDFDELWSLFVAVEDPRLLVALDSWWLATLRDAVERTNWLPKLDDDRGIDTLMAVIDRVEVVDIVYHLCRRDGKMLVGHETRLIDALVDMAATKNRNVALRCTACVATVMVSPKLLSEEFLTAIIDGLDDDDDPEETSVKLAGVVLDLTAPNGDPSEVVQMVKASLPRLVAIVARHENPDNVRWDALGVIGKVVRRGDLQMEFVQAGGIRVEFVEAGLHRIDHDLLVEYLDKDLNVASQNFVRHLRMTSPAPAFIFIDVLVAVFPNLGAMSHLNAILRNLVRRLRSRKALVEAGVVPILAEIASHHYEIFWTLADIARDRRYRSLVRMHVLEHFPNDDVHDGNILHFLDAISDNAQSQVYHDDDDDGLIYQIIDDPSRFFDVVPHDKGSCPVSCEPPKDPEAGRWRSQRQCAIQTVRSNDDR